MTLAERLAQWWEETRERAPEVYAAYTDFVAALHARGVARACLGSGERLPAFELPNAEGRLVSSEELLAQGPFVLSFFRGGWCPYCRMELEALEEVWPELRAAGARLAAITPDTGRAFLDAKRRLGLGYEILSDVDNGLALQLGLVFSVPDEIRRLWLRLGIDLGARHGNSGGAWLLPVPATYIVDRTGIIRHAFADPDFRRRMEPSDIVARLQSMP